MTVLSEFDSKLNLHNRSRWQKGVISVFTSRSRRKYIFKRCCKNCMSVVQKAAIVFTNGYTLYQIEGVLGPSCQDHTDKSCFGFDELANHCIWLDSPRMKTSRFRSFLVVLWRRFDSHQTCNLYRILFCQSSRLCMHN